MFNVGEVVKYEDMSGVITFIGSTYITIYISHTENTIINGINVLIHKNKYNSVITERQSEK